MSVRAANPHDSCNPRDRHRSGVFETPQIGKINLSCKIQRLRIVCDV